MNRNDAFNTMDFVVNNHIFKLLDAWNMRAGHSNYAKNFIQETYNTLNTALNAPNKVQYEVKFEMDDINTWSIDIRNGVPMTSSHYILYFISYWINSDGDFSFSIGKYQIWYSSGYPRKLNKEEYEELAYFYNINDGNKCYTIEMKLGNKVGRTKDQFFYTNGKAEFTENWIQGNL